MGLERKREREREMCAI